MLECMFSMQGALGSMFRQRGEKVMFMEGHTAGKSESWDLNPGLSESTGILY